MKTTEPSELIIKSKGFDKRKVPGYLDFGAIDALVVEGVLVFNDRRYTVTQRAYEIEVFDFQNPTSDPLRSYVRDTHRLMSESFDREELDQLCFELNVNTDWIFGDEKDRPYVLLQHLYRNNRLDELGPILRNIRPKVEWPIFPIMDLNDKGVSNV